MNLKLEISALVVAALSLGACGTLQTATTRPQARVTLRVADAALASGAPEVALRVAELVLDNQPNNCVALVTKGDALYAMGAMDQARDAYRAAVAADADNVGGRIGLGRTLVRAAPHDAEIQFLAALSRQPDNLIALNNLGVARDLQGDHELAQQAYREALALNSEMADVKTNLGLSLAMSGQGMQAMQILRPVPVAPDAGAKERPELPVTMARAHDTRRSGPVVEQTAQIASAHFDTPIAVTSAPVASVHSEPLLPPIKEPVRPATDVSPTLPPRPVAQPQYSTARAGQTQQLVDHAVKPTAMIVPSPAPLVAVPSARRAGPQQATLTDEGIYVQMASLGSERGAQTIWQHLGTRWGALLGDHAPTVQQAEVHDRTSWRLRIGGFASVTKANDFCQKLRAVGSDCWTVGLVARN
jgi:Tfp pilus assembly protein PilF